MKKSRNRSILCRLRIHVPNYFISIGGRVNKAGALLTALRLRQCGHGSSYTCGTCEARITAEVWLEGSGFNRDTLTVAIMLAEALEISHNANPNQAGMEGSIRQAHYDRCRGCKALARWEKLFP